MVDKSSEQESGWITATELAVMFRISVPTLYRILKYGPARERNKNPLDLRQVPDQWIGGRRFWSRAAAESLLGEAV